MSVYEHLKTLCKENREKVIQILIEYCLTDYKTFIPLWGYARIMKLLKHLGWWSNGKIDSNLEKYRSLVIEKYEASYATIAKLHPRLKKDQFDLIFNNVCTNCEDISIEYEFGDNIEKWKNQLNVFIEKNFIKKQQALDIYCIIASCVIKRKLFVLFEEGDMKKITEIWWENKPKENVSTQPNQTPTEEKKSENVGETEEKKEDAK